LTPFCKSARSRIVRALIVAITVAMTAGGLGACNAATPTPVVHDSVDRGSWQLPDQVVSALAVRPGTQIADIGAGSGFFTFRLAKATGLKGKVWAVDLDPASLVRLRYAARRLKITNIQTLVGSPRTTRLSPRSIDLAFLSNTYHHIENRVDYFAALHTALKPKGRVVIIDLNRQAFSRRSSPHAVAKAVIIEEMKIAGFRVQTDHRFLPKQSFLEFVVAGPPRNTTTKGVPVRPRRSRP
jgi:arsenite methyltransferase